MIGSLRLLLLTTLLGSAAFGQGARILLTPSRLHRLQRDRDRSTPLWQNLEARVKNVPDSPERGFELALYSVVSSDETRGREAVAWALTHPCQTRQVALVLNWTRELATPEQRQQIAARHCPASDGGPFTRMRDDFFWTVAEGTDDDFNPPELSVHGLPEPEELYALIELIDALRTRQHRDLRQSDVNYFGRLPELFLLGFPPALLDHPTSAAHQAALALVSLDPNLESSQFLQSWAMESRFLSADSPEVAYEFLWADPYLPGLGYENLRPWLYIEAQSSLWARSDWTRNACWIHITPAHTEALNCPAGWDNAPARFGPLELLPFGALPTVASQQSDLKPCVEMPVTSKDNTVMLRTARPRTTVGLPKFKPPRLISSDAAGLLFVSVDDGTQACLARPGRRER